MRISAGAIAVAILCLVPSRASAQEKAKTVQPTLMDAVSTVHSVKSSRLSELDDRLRAIERRLREDERLRRAGPALGLGVAAFSILHGRHSMTFVGTQALRLGLDRQLTLIRHRSGLTVEPSVGYRAFAITVSRTFN